MRHPSPDSRPRRTGPRATLAIGGALAALCAPPLLGAWLAGQPIARYLHFPPRVQYIAHPGPWPPAIALFAVLGAVLVAALIFLLWPRTGAPPPSPRRPDRFPAIGWAALGALALSWLFAWTRWEALSAVQSYSFVPLWLSYIALVNVLTFRRTGTCLWCRRRGLFVALFPASAAFWWYFEYLNRFVQNWQYVGVDVTDATGYALHATLAFATVLPAVASTQQWLASFAVLRRGWDRPIRIHNPRPLALSVLAACVAALWLLGARPALLFPVVWLAPVGIVLAVQALGPGQSYLAPLARGRWEIIYLPALAALCCGFFWEMWNAYSAAKWVYHIAFVERWKLFEMPALGYLGYLPFGVQCAVVIELVARALDGRLGGVEPGR